VLELLKPIYGLLLKSKVRTCREGTIKKGSGGDLWERKLTIVPVEAAIDVIGGKWKPLILWWLHHRTHRFAALRRLMPGITEKMLTQRLRELEADGIVHRRIYPTVPPKVEYSLTDYGRSLKRALQAICDWGREHMKRIEAVEVPPDQAIKVARERTTSRAS
jgi:DNA-binding HxlR family transcriptional regulator